MSALDAMDDSERVLFRTVVGRRDPSLLAAIEETASPCRAERSQVVDTLASEFDEHVSGPSWEPSEHGRAVDALLGSFLRHFPLSDP